ncbi:MAG: DUF6261 family protein [Tannerellaceae bacterium]|jgi:hypothetical protein|nr:DUF6261 family protein [Tannerellaceae bacterium]
MKTIRIPLRNLHKEEWFELHTTFKKKALLFDAEEIGIAKLIHNCYIPLYDQAEDLLRVLHRSVYTAEVEEANEQRNGVLQGFYLVVKGSRKQPETIKLKAALRLFNLLKGYKHYLFGKGYMEKSGAINTLMQSLRGAYRPDVEILGLGDWVAALDAAERKFLLLTGEREEENIAKPLGSLAEVRRQVDAVYVAAINVVDAGLIADGLGGKRIETPESEKENDPSTEAEGKPENVTYEFVVSWNETLKRYRNLLKQREGRKTKKKEYEDTSGEISPDREDSLTESEDSLILFPKR